MSARIKPLSEGPQPKAPKKRPSERRMRDKNYLGFLHELPCCVSGRSEGVIAHHLTIGRGRMGVKEDDSLALPLHHTLHDQHPGALHVVGEENFWNRLGINPFDLCRDLFDLYQQRGPAHRQAMQLLYGHRSLGEVRKLAGLISFYDRFRDGSGETIRN